MNLYTGLEAIQALVGILILAIIAVVAWKTMVARRRGKPRSRPSSTGNLIGGFDEFFSPSRHEARVLLEEKKRQASVTPKPDKE